MAEVRKMTAGVQAEVRDAFAEGPPTFPAPPPSGSAAPASTETPGTGPATSGQSDVAVTRESDPPASA
jgi:hypothetical protein